MRIKIYLSLYAALFLPLTSTAQTDAESESHFNLYGFGRASFVWDNQNLDRSDLFVPANIKIGTPKTPNFFIGAKQTRLGIDFKQVLNGHPLSIKIEGDFHNDASDATGLFRMRQAYADYKFILVGMAWSNFFDEEVNPTLVDFEGPSNSTLLRTPQAKFSTYKSKNVLSLSFENPIENITLGDSITALPERVPDVIAAYRINSHFGFIKIAALVRELRYQSDEARSLIGYGATIMSTITTHQKDKLKFQAVMGTGVARYIQGASGLNYDAIYNGTTELDALQMYGANLSYEHHWKDHLYSSLTGGFLGVEENSNLKNSNYKTGYYVSLNLFAEVVKNLTFGWECVAGERINIDDERGSALRVQMNATYKFNKSIN